MNCEFVELRRKLIKREFKRMNDMQFSAVTTVDGPVLILAGAGSGKTTVLINRISNMIRFGHAYELDSDEYATEEDVSELRRCLDENLPAPEWLGVGRVRPWEILAITFTNKAARELKERLDASVGEDAGDVWAATFHSTCARILRRNADRLGFSQSFTIYSADDQKRLVKDVMKRLNIDDKFLPVKSVLGEISHAKNELITPEQYAEGAQADVRRKMISDCYCAYQKQLKEYDAMAAYLKTYSDRTIRNVFWSGNNYALPQMPAAGGAKITYWYGDDEKKDRRSNIRFIKRYFPQIRIHGIPKMAHAELVIVHPEEFCRYAEKFLAGPAEAAQPVGTQDRRMTR